MFDSPHCDLRLRSRGSAFAVVVSVAVLLALGGATSARAGPRLPGPPPAELASASGGRSAAAPVRSWLSLSRLISRRWVSLQERGGSFPDVLLGPGQHSRYGDAMLGYALLQSGLRDRRRALIDAGLRAITWAARRRAPAYSGDAPFENLAVAGSYTLMRRSAPGYAPFRRVRRRWERFMRSRVRVYIHRADEPSLPPEATRGYWNKWLVESIAMLEFLRSGLSSKRPGAALARQDDTRRRIVSVVNGIVPDMAAQASVPNGRGYLGFVLSDPPANPLAYHAFSLGLLARAIRLLGPAARPRAREALLRMVDATWALMAPDGDVAYVGRSQEQGWALTFTAYGAEVAAGLTRDRQRADRARGVARRAVDRLRQLHPFLPSGLAITPGLGRDLVGGRAGLDSYAHMVDYNGLTLLGLNWAIAETRGRTSTAPIGSDSLGPMLVDSGNAAMATVRTPSTWFAVKRSRSSPSLRYDFGLVALKRRTEQGWHDLLPLRPVGKGADSAGPILTAGGVEATPVGETLTTAPDGTVTIDGGFVDGTGTLVRRARFTFAPVAEGVRLSFTGLAGDSYEVSSFHRSAPAASAGGGGWLIGARGEGIRIAAPLGLLGAPKIALTPGYASAMDSGLTRARATFSLRSGGEVAVTYGALGG